MALAPNALTTVATLEAALKLTPGTDTPTLERLIAVASDAIEGFCGRTFRQATVNESRAGSGARELYPEHQPVTALTVALVAGQDVRADVRVAADGSHLWLRAGWPRAEGMGVSYAGGDVVVPGYEQQNVELEYVAGYVLPQAGATRTLPYDLEHACIIAASTMYQRQGQDENVSGEAVGGASVQYAGRNPGIGRAGDVLPDVVRTMLGRYRRLR